MRRRDASRPPPGGVCCGADVGVEGRGLVTTQRVRAGEPLLRVPRSLVLTAGDAAEQSSLAAAIQREELPSWSALALFLVEARLGRGTEWGPYAAVLPQSSGSVLEWKQGQVETAAPPPSAGARSRGGDHAPDASGSSASDQNVQHVSE